MKLNRLHLIAISMLLGACAYKAPAPPVERLPVDPLFQSEGITHTFIFRSVLRPGFEGEGFFLTLPGGQEVFVQGAPDDNPHDIANLKRSLQAIRKAGARVDFPRTATDEVFLATKYELNAEHRALTPEEIHALAEIVAGRGERRTVAWVNYRNLQMPAVTLRFPARGIVGIDPVTMTTGGSVYVLTVHFRDGDALSLVAAASRPDAQDRLNAKKAALEKAVRSSKMIRAEDLQYQREFFTNDGVRRGWSAFVDKVGIE